MKGELTSPFWSKGIQGDNRNIALVHGVLRGSSEAPLSGDQTVSRLWCIEDLYLYVPNQILLQRHIFNWLWGLDRSRGMQRESDSNLPCQDGAGRGKISDFVLHAHILRS